MEVETSNRLQEVLRALEDEESEEGELDRWNLHPLASTSSTSGEGARYTTPCNVCSPDRKRLFNRKIKSRHLNFLRGQLLLQLRSEVKMQ